MSARITRACWKLPVSHKYETDDTAISLSSSFFSYAGGEIETFPIIRYNQTWLLQTGDIPESSAAFL